MAAVSDGFGGMTYLYTRTRAEAAAKLTTALKTVADYLPLVPERQTVGDFLSSWLETTARPTVRPSTFVSTPGSSATT